MIFQGKNNFNYFLDTVFDKKFFDNLFYLNRREGGRKADRAKRLEFFFVILSILRKFQSIFSNTVLTSFIDILIKIEIFQVTFK